MDEDWDNLIILDGCRYDMFKSAVDIGGELELKRSVGCRTSEFLDKTFSRNSHHDTIYISSNPHTRMLEEESSVYKVHNLYADEYFDAELESVPPETIVEKTLDAHSENPDKRVITHFMQPHVPFIGEKGRQIDQSGNNSNYGDDEWVPSVWAQLRYGLSDVTRDEIWDAYVENLEVAIPHVERLVAELPGKTVVTSDHGNLVGERLRPIPVRGYGHDIGGLRSEGLVRVPWLVFESAERRDVTADEPVETTAVEDEVIEDRLRQLGYA